MRRPGDLFSFERERISSSPRPVSGLEGDLDGAPASIAGPFEGSRGRSKGKAIADERIGDRIILAEQSGGCVGVPCGAGLAVHGGDRDVD